MPWPNLRKSRANESAAKPPPKKEESSTDQRLRRLARKLDELPARDAQRRREAEELERKQNEAARALFELCQKLAKTLNPMLKHLQIELSPETFSAGMLDGEAGMLIQLNAAGRIVQLALAAREPSPSTEHYRVPYILRGAIRWFNQEWLDRQLVQEHWLFCCLNEGAAPEWRYLDPHTRKSGALNLEYLISRFEELL